MHRFMDFIKLAGLGSRRNKIISLDQYVTKEPEKLLLIACTKTEKKLPNECVGLVTQLLCDLKRKDLR